MVSECFALLRLIELSKDPSFASRKFLRKNCSDPRHFQQKLQRETCEHILWRKGSIARSLTKPGGSSPLVLEHALGVAHTRGWVGAIKEEARATFVSI